MAAKGRRILSHETGDCLIDGHGFFQTAMSTAACIVVGDLFGKLQRFDQSRNSKLKTTSFNANRSSVDEFLSKKLGWVRFMNQSRHVGGIAGASLGMKQIFIMRPRPAQYATGTRKPKKLKMWKRNLVRNPEGSLSRLQQLAARLLSLGRRLGATVQTRYGTDWLLK
jgi:hypothetical protein